MKSSEKAGWVTLMVVIGLAIFVPYYVWAWAYVLQAVWTTALPDGPELARAPAIAIILVAAVLAAATRKTNPTKEAEREVSDLLAEMLAQAVMPWWLLFTAHYALLVLR